MKKAHFFIFALLAVLLEATFLNSFRIFNVKPALTLACVVLAAIKLQVNWALSLALFAGLLKDVFTHRPFGLNTFLFICVTVAIIKLSRKISLDNAYLRIGLLSVIAALYSILTLCISCYFFNFSVSVGIAVRTILLETIYTAVIFMLASKIIR